MVDVICSDKIGALTRNELAVSAIRPAKPGYGEAAGVVLTEPGLGGIVACISEGRSASQRVLTYTLTILINKCVTLIAYSGPA